MAAPRPRPRADSARSRGDAGGVGGGIALRYIAPPPELVKSSPLMFRAALIVGPMGSGKTTWMLAKLGEAAIKLTLEGVWPGEICVVYGKEAALGGLLEAAYSMLGEAACTYMYIFNDDAPVHAMSRRSMSEENVEASKLYIMIRHRLAEHGFRGYLFAAHATQVYTLVDATFRRTAGMKVFKDYPDDPTDFQQIARLVGGPGLDALRDISYRLHLGTDPEKRWQAVHEALVVVKRARALVRAKPGAWEKALKLGIRYAEAPQGGGGGGGGDGAGGAPGSGSPELQRAVQALIQGGCIKMEGGWVRTVGNCRARLG